MGDKRELSACHDFHGINRLSCLRVARHFTNRPIICPHSLLTLIQLLWRTHLCVFHPTFLRIILHSYVIRRAYITSPKEVNLNLELVIFLLRNFWITGESCIATRYSTQIMASIIRRFGSTRNRDWSQSTHGTDQGWGDFGCRMWLGYLVSQFNGWIDHPSHLGLGRSVQMAEKFPSARVVAVDITEPSQRYSEFYHYNLLYS